MNEFDDVVELTDEERKELNLPPEEGADDPSTDPDPATDPNPEDPPADPPADPQPEDPPADPPADPVVNDEDPYLKAFNEVGLSKQFVDPMDAIRRIPYQNQYIAQLQEQNTVLRQQVQPQTPEASSGQQQQSDFDIDEFNVEFDADPRGALIKAGFVPATEMVGMRQQLAILHEREQYRDQADTVAALPGLKEVETAFRMHQLPAPGANAVWDEMGRLANTMPGVEKMPFKTQMEILHPMATQRLSASTPAVPPVPASDKAAASTASGTSKTHGGKEKPVDVTNMTADQQLAHYEKQGLVGQ